MVRRIGLALFALLALATLAAAGALTCAHVGIRSERPPLPEAAPLAAGAPGPARAFVLHTATQGMPRSLVLDADGDPDPQAPYTMTFPAFALEWPDGRLLLVDTGMDAEAAHAFGRPIALVPGAEPIEVLGDAATQLGPAVERVAGVVFTHLHVDHVAGLRALCAARRAPLPVYLNAAQAERGNYTTRGGLSLIEDAGCAEPHVLRGRGHLLLPGLPGVVLLHVAGHTPGSQLVRARVGAAADARELVFVGDVVNHAAGIDHDLPKPLLYRLLVTPEANDRLGVLRRWLRALRDAHGAALVVSHHREQIASAPLAAWP